MAETLLNGIKISYSDEGRGQPLIIIGGLNSGRNMWYLQTRVFRRYFRVITFDNRGSGKSGKPAGPYSIQAMAADTLALMDHLSLARAHLLGVSMGSLIAQEIAINCPHRVQKLILGTSFSRIDDIHGPTPELRQLVSLPLEKRLNPMAALMLNKWFFRALLLPLARLKNRSADLNSVRHKLDACMKYGCDDRLAKIKCPVLVIGGTADRVILPASSDEIAKNITQAELVKIKGGSHLLFIENSGQFNRAVLDFLRGV